MFNANEAALEILTLLMQAQEKIEHLREDHTGPGEFNGRALSIALTELETAQLWVANARPD